MLTTCAGFSLALLRSFEFGRGSCFNLVGFNGIHRGCKGHILQASIIAHPVEVSDYSSVGFHLDWLEDLEDFAWHFNPGGESPRKKEREKKKSG